jgi:hypothetical protein
VLKKRIRPIDKVRGDATSAAYQAYVSIGAGRAARYGGLVRSFSATC